MNATLLLLLLLCTTSSPQSYASPVEKGDNLSPRSKIKQLTHVNRRLDSIIIALGDLGKQIRKEGCSVELTAKKAALIKELQKQTPPSHREDNTPFRFVLASRKLKKRTQKLRTVTRGLYCKDTFCWQTVPCQHHTIKKKGK